MTPKEYRRFDWLYGYLEHVSVGTDNIDEYVGVEAEWAEMCQNHHYPLLDLLKKQDHIIVHVYGPMVHVHCFAFSDAEEVRTCETTEFETCYAHLDDMLLCMEEDGYYDPLLGW